MEADLTRYYGLSISDYLSDGVSPMRMLMLLRNLPRDAATVRAVSGEPAEWTRTDVLLTDIYTVLTGQEHPARKHIVEQVTFERGRKEADEAIAAFYRRLRREEVADG